MTTTTSTSQRKIVSIEHFSRNCFRLILAKARDLRLDQYLALNTSEDNVSFEKIMDDTEKKERTKLHQSWLYEQQALTHSVGRPFSFCSFN